MRIIFVNALFSAVLFLEGCSSKNKTYYEERYFKYRDSFVGLNEELLKIRGVNKIESDGTIDYKKSALRLNQPQVAWFSAEFKRLKVDNVKISDNLFDDSGYHLEYEIGRSGFVNDRVFYLVFNSKKEDVQRLMLVSGCASFSLIEDGWYLKELYDDGVC